MRKEWILVLVGFSLLVLDRITKLIFLEKKFSIINYTRNTGALFGLFEGGNLLFIMFSFIILILIALNL